MNEHEREHEYAIRIYARAGRKWHSLSRAEQERYYELSRTEKQKHLEDHPGTCAAHAAAPAVLLPYSLCSRYPHPRRAKRPPRWPSHRRPLIALHCSFIARTIFHRHTHRAALNAHILSRPITCLSFYYSLVTCYSCLPFGTLNILLMLSLLLPWWLNWDKT